jgi:hypothetical protein
VTDLAAFEFNDFGKAKIKNYKVSPDAFFQAAIHIATKRTLYVPQFFIFADSPSEES